MTPKLWEIEDEDGDTDISKVTELVALRSVGQPHVTIMTGTRAGEVLSLDSREEFIIGRSREADLRMDAAGVSRMHCRFVMTDAGYAIEDLGSTNGTLVNGVRVKRMNLRSGDRVQVGEDVVLQFALLDNAEEILAQQLYEMATRDPLTKAFNRRYFASRLTAELAHARRHKAPLSVMLLDLDFFKTVNDKFGHGAGDELLKRLVDEVQHMIRVEDLLARFGGEEFVLLTRATSLESATLVAERIRARIESLQIEYEGQIVSATVSIGVAEALECDAADPDEFLAVADRRLYDAKTLGRNRVVHS